MDSYTFTLSFWDLMGFAGLIFLAFWTFMWLQIGGLTHLFIYPNFPDPMEERFWRWINEDG
jgi:hypothetical protein